MTNPGCRFIKSHSSMGKVKSKELHPCECGCGTLVQHRFAPGHNARMKKAKLVILHPCECGCGELCKNRFLPGHNSRNRSEEEKKKFAMQAIGRTHTVSAAGKEVLRLLHTGEKSNFYIDGRSEKNNPYPSDFNGRLKELIRDRDNRQCQLCSKSEEDNVRKMPVHHIDYDKENLDPDNLISLCCSCHTKTNSNRSKWILYFQSNQRLTLIQGGQHGV